MKKQLFLTRSRINANTPLKADDAVLTVEQLKEKVRNAKSLPVKDGYQVIQGDHDWKAPDVGQVIEAIVTDSGQLWLLYEVDLDLLSEESRKHMLERKAGAYAAFEYSPETSYQDMVYATIYMREPDRFEHEKDDTTHQILDSIPDQLPI